MKALLKSPLVHFVAIGTVIFVLYGLLRGSGVDDNRRIEVGEQQIARLRELWMAQWKRPPTERELEGLIDSFIREEVLYREALAMGLDRDDTVVRRRLAQKIEFLADDLATRSEPLPDELERFLEENLERYELPGRVGFSHVYFSVDRRGEACESDALDALHKIKDGASPDEQGDPFMLQRDYPSRSEREVAELFGSEFGEALFMLSPGTWQGPVRSSYGLHLVVVRERTPSRTPELADVSDRVKNDLLSERRRTANEALVESLKERYQIVVEGR